MPGIRSWWMVSLFAGALLHAAAAGAQNEPPPPSNPSDIIVTGSPEPTRRAVEKQARAITQADGYYRLPLAQFQDPICPGIMGLPVDMAEMLVDRIRYNAERIGLDTAREGKCTPNLLVIIVGNGQKEINALKKKHGYLFKLITTAELRELAADPGPVHAWANTLVRSRQGDVLQGDADLGQVPTLFVAQSQSHIFLAHRLDIVNAVVMLDAQAINGLSITQIADYATMRGLARTRPVDGDGAIDTILSLFSPEGARPYEMSDFDLAYLRSLYGDIPNMPAVTKITRVNKELRKQRKEGAAP